MDIQFFQLYHPQKSSPFAKEMVLFAHFIQPNLELRSLNLIKFH